MFLLVCAASCASPWCALQSGGTCTKELEKHLFLRQSERWGLTARKGMMRLLVTVSLRGTTPYAEVNKVPTHENLGLEGQEVPWLPRIWLKLAPRAK